MIIPQLVKALATNNAMVRFFFAKDPKVECLKLFDCNEFPHVSQPFSKKEYAIGYAPSRHEHTTTFKNFKSATGGDKYTGRTWRMVLSIEELQSLQGHTVDGINPAPVDR